MKPTFAAVKCCGRKPLLYKRPNAWHSGPHYYCSRCDAAYDAITGQRVANWAWFQQDNGDGTVTWMRR